MKLPRRLLCTTAAFVLAFTPALAIPLQLAALPPEVEVVGNRAVVERVIELGRSDSQVQDHLRVLTSRYGPRLTSSPLLYEAQVWAKRKFESFGLEAHLEPWGEFPVGFWRGESRGRVVAPAERELEFITPAWSAGTLGPVRGRALIEPESMEAIEAARPLLANAFVLRPTIDREARRALEEEMGGGDVEKGRELRREITTAFEQACEEAGIAGFVRSGHSDGRLVTSGGYRLDPEKLPTRLSIMLRAAQFDELTSELRDGLEVVLEFDIDNRFVPGPIQNYNVVAELRGAELPDEYVIVQAHIDAWDNAQGACDNGTGVSTTLEAARLLTESGAHPRRTIRFVLYSGEEQGLLGSRAYVARHADEMERVSIVFNHDEGTNHLKGIQATPAMKPDFQRVFAPVRALDPERPFEVLEVDGLRQTGSSDHASFIAAGVPAFHWIQDNTGYRHIHHTQHDTFEAAIPAEQQHSALVVALAAYGFAELEGLVDRTAMSPPPARRMGVILEGTTITSLTPNGKAAAAGWQSGDVIVSIDGADVSDRREIAAELRKGGPEKRIVLRRGEETIESALDFGEEAEEPRRGRSRRGEDAGEG